MQKNIAWIFDLDNTLHDATPHIFPHINRGMTAYLQRLLGLDEQAASALRAHYWRTYGATLLGLMRHHAADPNHFLRETHQFAELARMVVADRAALSALRRLPGRKILYSNAPMHYVKAVLQVLGIRQHFDALYAVERVRFRPKPALAGFRLLLKAERLSPARTVMVDDTLENLQAAHRLGLRTVWVSVDGRAPGFVDVRVASLRNLVRQLEKLGIAG
jgi:putative hydrolase of the HAD superfamily